MYAATKKSADKLKRAFFSLVEEKHYSKITVTELIGRADVSRTTFYRHYKDVYDMYDKICDEMLRDIVVGLVPSEGDKDYDLAAGFEFFCEKMIARKYYVGLLCGKNGGKKFFETGAAIARDCILNGGSVLSDKELFALKFVAFSCISTYVKCVIEGSEFERKNILMYKKILADAQKAGVNND